MNQSSRSGLDIDRCGAVSLSARIAKLLENVHRGEKTSLEKHEMQRHLKSRVVARNLRNLRQGNLLEDAQSLRRRSAEEGSGVVSKTVKKFGKMKRGENRKK